MIEKPEKKGKKVNQGRSTHNQTRMNHEPRARRRMDKLVRHLTDPASGYPASRSRTPQRSKLRRELASAQKERVLIEYGYELKDEDSLLWEHEPSPRKRVHRDVEDEAVDSDLHDCSLEARQRLARACRQAHDMGLIGANLGDTVSMFVPEARGYLVKPSDIRFHQVTAENLQLVMHASSLPKGHAELLSANEEHRVVFSVANEDCSMVAIMSHGLLPICQEALRLHGRVGRADERNLHDRVQRATYSDVSSWLIKRRGATCVGDSVELAFITLLDTIRACSFQVRALCAVGGDLTRLDIPRAVELMQAKRSVEETCPSTQLVAHFFPSL